MKMEQDVMETLASDGPQVRFTRRDACIACGSGDLETKWAARFSDPSIAAYMADFHYNADLGAALGDEPFELVCCRDCGIAFHRHVMAEEWVPVVYGQWIDENQIAQFEAQAAGGRDPDGFEAGIQLIKLVLRLRHLVAERFAPPYRLMDFGCGDGKVLQAASVLGFAAYGIDISDSREERAGRAGHAVFRSLEGFDARMGEPVHAVVLSQVLEHILDPLGLLIALAGRMAPGGVLMVAVPDCTGIAEPADFAQFHNVQPLEHVNAFTPESLSGLARRAGFDPVRKPAAYVGTRLPAVARSAGALVLQKVTTDQFFRLDAPFPQAGRAVTE